MWLWEGNKSENHQAWQNKLDKIEVFSKASKNTHISRDEAFLFWCENISTETIVIPISRVTNCSGAMKLSEATVIPTRNQFLINFCRLMQTEIYLTVHDLCLASRQDKYLGLSEWICIKWSLINQTSWGTSIPINSGYCIKLIHFNIILKVETTSKQWVDKLETAQCTADKQRKS